MSWIVRLAVCAAVFGLGTFFGSTSVLVSLEQDPRVDLSALEES
jgi:hypothetical protein